MNELDYDLLMKIIQSLKDDELMIPHDFWKIDAPKGGRRALREQMKLEWIKAFITANEGKILAIKDFEKATGTTRAGHYLRALTKRGLVERIRVATGEVGVYYTYKWVEVGSGRIQNDTSNKQVLWPVVRVQNAIETFYKENPFKLDESQMAGLILFKEWLGKNSAK